jgi:hypothetical protein
MDALLLELVLQVSSSLPAHAALMTLYHCSADHGHAGLFFTICFICPTRPICVGSRC